MVRGENISREEQILKRFADFVYDLEHIEKVPRYKGVPLLVGDLESLKKLEYVPSFLLLTNEEFILIKTNER